MEGYLTENIHANAVCVKLDSGDEVPLYTHLKYRQANERLLTLIRNYHITTATDYLDNCTHYIRY